MWYQNPGWYAAVVSFVGAAITALLTLRIIKLTHAAHSTYQCDSQFLEIEKLFISNPKLYEFYNLGPEMRKYWGSLNEDQKRLYILTEIHYFHLAFAHREFMANRIPEEYWKVYKNWLETLIRYAPMFLEVHKREGRNFENEFASLVTDTMEALGIACKETGEDTTVSEGKTREDQC